MNLSYPREELFLRRPSVFLHESLVSYLYRISTSNFCNSINWVANYLQMPTSRICNNEFNDESLEILSNKTALDKQFLYHMSLDFYKDTWGFSIFHKAIVKNKVKYCPYCIRENYYQKKIWILHPVSMCLDHNILLVDECPSCKLPASIQQFMQGYCKCGNQFFKYTDSNKFINKIMSQSQIYFQSLLNGNPSSSIPLLQDLSVKDYLNLAYHSAFLLHGSKSYIHDEDIQINGYNNKCNWSSLIFFSNVYWMYHNFPVNYYKVLDSLKNRRNDTRSIQHMSYEKLFKSSQFKVIQEAYEHYWLQEYDNGMVNRNFSIFKNDDELLDKRKYISREEVKDLYSLTNYQISQFETNLQLKKKLVKQGKKTLIMIDKLSLEKVLQLRNRFITQKEAATILGIKKDSMKWLIDAKLLSLVKCPVNNHMMLKIADVEYLLKQCSGEYSEREINGLGFFEALHKFSQRGLSIVNIIALLKDKKLNAISNKKEAKLSDLYFSENSLIRCLKTVANKKRQNQDYYTLSDVMDILDIGYKALKNIIEHQILSPVNIVESDNGRKQFFFDKDIINEFSKKYITSSEAVREYRIPKSTLIGWVKRGELSDFSKGCCKAFLLNKKELQRVIKQRGMSTLN